MERVDLLHPHEKRPRKIPKRQQKNNPPEADEKRILKAKLQNQNLKRK